MAEHTHLNPESFWLPGGSTGVLLMHGFTGAPPELRLVGEYLHQRGLTVSAPLLPGHGTYVDDMNQRTWDEWGSCAVEAYGSMAKASATVFVGGLSMGALLALHLAANEDNVAGVIAYSPALRISTRMMPLARFLYRFLSTVPKPQENDLYDPAAERHVWSYSRYPVGAAIELDRLRRHVRLSLHQITCPLLVVHSTGDAAVSADGADEAYQRTRSMDKLLLTLHRSGHGLTIDHEWPFVAAQTYRFVARRSA